ALRRPVHAAELVRKRVATAPATVDRVRLSIQRRAAGRHNDIGRDRRHRDAGERVVTGGRHGSRRRRDGGQRCRRGGRRGGGGGQRRDRRGGDRGGRRGGPHRGRRGARRTGRARCSQASA